MDALAAEIAKKKAQLGGAGGAKRRWVKTADLDQQRRQAVEDAAAGKRARSDAPPPAAAPRARAASVGEADTAAAKVAGRLAVLKDLSRDDIFARLRALGEPVTTFGEADGDRTRRLAALEASLSRLELEHVDLPMGDAGRHKGFGFITFVNAADAQAALEASATGADEDDYRLGGAYAIRNTFLKTNAAGAPRARPEEDDASDDSGDEDESPEKAPAAARDAEATPPSDFKKIRRWIRRHLKAWEATLVARADAAKRAPQGRVETKTYKQCKDYIRPLVKLCKKRELNAGLKAALVEMVDFCDAGEFVKANDAYILVAIGNSAWPIGVTSVGIHTRTARENVEQKNVAHVMNNEMQRKYLTSVKRLMKFAQDQRPDVAPSKKVT